MFLILTASADSYITNKLVKSSRKINSNVGLASTIDIFKLYDESYSPTESNPIELSRGLIKFDLSPLKNEKNINFLNDSSFKATMQLFDVLGGNTSPSNFNIEIFPLSQSFIEGIGRDVQQFLDNDICNFLSASSNSWHLSGANSKGNLGNSNIDLIVSGNLNDGNGFRFLGKNQYFIGKENLSIDVSDIISGTISNQIPDHGFRISFNGFEEIDNKTRFVKRFYSRHTSNQNLRPRLLISFNDSIKDDSESSQFNFSNSLFLNSYNKNVNSNLLSGSSLSEITGNNCILLKISTGSFQKVVTGSQYSIGNNFISGTYKANFTILSSDTSEVIPSASLSSLISSSGSITFNKEWVSLDNSIVYFKDKITIKKQEINSFESLPKELEFSITNMKSTFKESDIFRFRVFVRDLNESIFASKIPLRLKSIPMSNVYYKLIDLTNKKDIIPYLIDNNGTVLSQDSVGLYFDVNFNNFPIGKQLSFCFKCNSYGFEKEYKVENSFAVEK